MYHLVSKFVLYSDLAHEGLLADMAGIYRDWGGRKRLDREEQSALLARVNASAKRLLDIATTYGFDENLWRDYLAFALLTCENSFSLTAERHGATKGGTVNILARADFAIFRELATWDFGPLDEALATRVLTSLTQWHSIPKEQRNYYANISIKVRSISRELEKSANADEVFDLVSTAYTDWGVGFFGLGGAFRIRRAQDSPCRNAYTQDAYTVGTLEFVPINNTDNVLLSDLIGYELQKEQLVANTEAFVEGRPANNVLLYGDAGTGKSTSVKALINQYADKGLRMVEIYKYQFRDLSRVIEAVKHRNYRFIIFIDDLSFEENEVEYKFLKAVIEGGVESRPENVLIYATSNRRHLVREMWSDRSDMKLEGDIHRSDTMEEKLSLAERFGVAINYSTPTPALFHEIVLELAARQLPNSTISETALLAAADRWEIRHGGVSGRTAQQFIDHLAGCS